MYSTKAIVDLIRKRDEKGISLLYDQYAYALLGISYRIVGDKQIAEDVLNKSFLKIWDNIGKYDEKKGALFTWMSRIVKNSSLDARRAKSFVQTNKTDSLTNSAYYLEATKSSTAKLDTDKLLTGLDDKYKVILEYLYLRGYTQKELSDELEIPIGTVKTRLKKAIDILRKNIGPETNMTTFISMLFIILTSNLIP